MSSHLEITGQVFRKPFQRDTSRKMSPRISKFIPYAHLPGGLGVAIAAASVFCSVFRQPSEPYRNSGLP